MGLRWLGNGEDDCNIYGGGLDKDAWGIFVDRTYDFGHGHLGKDCIEHPNITGRD